MIRVLLLLMLMRMPILEAARYCKHKCKLKLTCNADLLGKPFAEAIVDPFLGAFNKKRGTAFSSSQLARPRCPSRRPRLANVPEIG